MEMRKEAARLLIRIPAAKNYFVMFFMVLWICVWSLMGVIGFFSFPEFYPFILVWLFTWALVGLIVISRLVWMLGGVEEIEFTTNQLTVTHSSLGIQRQRVFQTKDIIGLLTSSSYTGLFRNNYAGLPFGFGRRGSIQLHHRGKVVRIGNGLDDFAARELLQAIKETGYLTNLKYQE